MVRRSSRHVPTLALLAIAASCGHPSPATDVVPAAATRAPVVAAQRETVPATQAGAAPDALLAAEVVAPSTDARAVDAADEVATPPDDVVGPEVAALSDASGEVTAAATHERVYGDPSLREAPALADRRQRDDPFWSTRGGQRVKEWPGAEDSLGTRFSRDRKRVLVYGAAQAAVFDTQYGETLALLAAQDRSPLVEARLSPDGKWLVASDNMGRLHLYDVDHRKLLKSWTATKVDEYILASEGVATNDLDISADGTLLAAAMPPDGAVTLWELPSGKRLGVFDSNIRRLQFSPDGKTLATVGDTLWFWDTATRKKRSAVLLHATDLTWTDADTVLAYSNGGRRVRASDGVILDDFKDLRSPIVALAMLPDGRPVAVDTSTRVVVWTPEGEPAIVRELGTDLAGDTTGRALALARDGSRIYLCRGGETQVLFDVLSGAELARAKRADVYCGRAVLGHAGPVMIATSTLLYWEPGPADALLADAKGSSDGVEQMSVSDDGTLMLAVRGGVRLGVYGPRGTFKRRLTPCGAKNFAYDPAVVGLSADGHVYAATCEHPSAPAPAGKTTYGFEVGSLDGDGKVLGTFDSALWPRRIVPAPDGRRLAIIGSEAIEIRATPSGALLATVARLPSGPALLAWSPGGDAFLYVGKDGRPVLHTL